MLQAFISGLTTGLGLIVAIGAQNMYVLQKGLRKEHVFVIALICTLSDILLITLGVAGVGAVIKDLPVLKYAFQYGGAAFLFAYGIFAAVRAWKGGESMRLSSEAGRQSLRSAVLVCLGFTFLNPHVYLDTMVLMGSISVMFGDLRWYFAFGAFLASTVWFFSLGYGARLLTPLFKKPSSWRILDGIVALIMFALAFQLAFDL